MGEGIIYNVIQSVLVHRLAVRHPYTGQPPRPVYESTLPCIPVTRTPAVSAGIQILLN